MKIYPQDLAMFLLSFQSPDLGSAEESSLWPAPRTSRCTCPASASLRRSAGSRWFVFHSVKLELFFLLHWRVGSCLLGFLGFGFCSFVVVGCQQESFVLQYCGVGALPLLVGINHDWEYAHFYQGLKQMAETGLVD